MATVTITMRDGSSDTLDGLTETSAVEIVRQALTERADWEIRLVGARNGVTSLHRVGDIDRIEVQR